MPNPPINYGNGAGKTRQYASGCLVVFSVLLFSLAIFLPAYLEQRVHDGLSERLYYTPSAQNSDTFKWWADNDSPGAPSQYVSYRIVSISNPDEYILNGARPILRESGVYTLRKNVRRFNLTWDVDVAGRNILTYHEQQRFFFDPSRSNPGSSMNDTYRVINVVFLGFTVTSLGVPFGGDLLWATYPDGNFTDATRLFTNRTVQEILFGYLDTHVNASHPGVLKNQSEADAMREGRCAIFVGDDDNSLVRNQFMWQGNQDILTASSILFPDSKTPTWGSASANRVYGTDGQVFRRNLKKGDSVSSFNYDVSRSVTLQHTGETYSVRGIELFKFGLHPRTFLNASSYPDNAAYNQFGPEGFFNITRPRGGVPVFVSMPHFYGVDARVRNVFEGLPPDSALTLYIGVEPRSGITMHAHKRNQVNFMVTQLNFSRNFGTTPVRWLQNVRPFTYVPFVWGDETGMISDSQANLFKNSLQVALTARDVLKYGGYVIGLVALIIAIVLYLTIPTEGRDKLLRQTTDEI